MKKGRLKEKSWEIAAILLCVIVLSFGISQKEGYHMDELLSFELANGEFNPWIVPTQPQGRLAKFVENEIRGESFSETMGNLWSTCKDVIQNRGNSKLLSYQADVYEEPVWIGAEEFSDYITVDDKDAFNYVSVYFNVKDDNHPPLHFMLLHTVCSLFRGQIKPFMGCVINLTAAVGTMLLLMRLGRQFACLFGIPDKARLSGILAALFYGLSTGAMACVLLIRMYGVLTFFCVALFYICMQKWQHSGFEKKNFRLIAVTVLGFLTQYFFLFYCIFLFLTLAAGLLWKRRFRECLCLVRSMVIAAAAGILLFPFALSDVFSSSRGVEALENLAAGVSGYGQRLSAFLEILVSRTFGNLMWILCAMGLCCAVWGLVCLQKKKTPLAEICLLFVPPVGYFFLAARMSPYLVDRYIMPLFPFVCLWGALALVLWLGKLEGYFGNKKGIFAGTVCGICLLWQVLGLFDYDGSYLYRGYEKQEELSQEYASLPCICVYEGVGYYENLLEFTHYEKTLLVRLSELIERRDRESVASLEQAVVLVKSEADWEEVLTVMEEVYGLSLKQELLADSVHQDRIFLLGK